MTMRTLTAYPLSLVKGATTARTFLTLLVPMLLACAAHAQSASPSAWVEVCDRGTATSKDKDGKELRKVLEGCVIFHDRLDANTGRVLVGAYLYRCRFNGQEKQLFKVMVPLGTTLQRVTLFPKDLWDNVLRNEKLDRAGAARLESLTLKLNSMPCGPEGCPAEMEATPDILTGLKSSGGLVVYAISESGASIALQVPLVGFAQKLEAEQVPRWTRHTGSELRRELMRCAKVSWPESKRP